MIVRAQVGIAYHPLTRGAVLIDGTYLGTPILLDEAGARVEPALFKGLSGVGEENAFMVFAVRGDWPRSGSLSLNLPGERGGTDINYTWNGSTWVKAPANAQPFAEMPERIVAAYYDGGLIGQSVWGGRALSRAPSFDPRPRGSDSSLPR